MNRLFFIDGVTEDKQRRREGKYKDLEDKERREGKSN
jgi:hypothetical protein